MRVPIQRPLEEEENYNIGLLSLFPSRPVMLAFMHLLRVSGYFKNSISLDYLGPGYLAQVLLASSSFLSLSPLSGSLISIFSSLDVS